MTLQQTGVRPEIIIRATDEDRLTELANGLLDHQPDLAETLLAELGRAKIVAAEAVPRDTVQMGSTFRYSADGRERRVTLVYPADADIDAGRVSVGTPIGAALLELAEGQTIDWTARNGASHELTIIAVER